MRYRVGLSCGGLGKEIKKETFFSCKEAGISAIEISVDKTKYGEIPFEQLEEWSKESGVEVWSMHMPFSVSMRIDISSEDEEVRRHTVDYFKELIVRANKAGIKRFVIHPSCEPIAEEERARKIQYSTSRI